MRIRPAGNIARRIDLWDAGLQECVYSNAAVELKAGLFSQRQAGPHPNTDHHHIGVKHAAALQRGALAIDRRHGIAEMKDDAVLFVQRTDEVAHRGSEYALPRPMLRSKHVKLDLARAQ